MIVSRRVSPRRKKRRDFRFLFVFVTTTTMIATGGFGAYPDNALTRSFQQVVSDNISADFLEPFNSYMEYISVPTIQPRTGFSAKNNSQPGPSGSSDDQSPGPAEAAIIETIVASIEETMPRLPTVTLSVPSPTMMQTITQTPVPTFTSFPTLTESPTPTWTIPPVVILITSTKKPPPAKTPTVMPSSGFNVNNITLNQVAGSSLVVTPGTVVTVLYDFNVYDECPACLTQLVTGLTTAGSQNETCAFDGEAASYPPGTSGSENAALFMPDALGIYYINVEYFQEADCATALNLYGTGVGQQAPSQVIAQIEVVTVLP